MYSLKDLQSMKVSELKKLVTQFELEDKDIKDKNSLYFSI